VPKPLAFGTASNALSMDLPVGIVQFKDSILKP
jgi:hypothetical protein